MIFHVAVLNKCIPSSSSPFSCNNFSHSWAYKTLRWRPKTRKIDTHTCMHVRTQTCINAHTHTHTLPCIQLPVPCHAAPRSGEKREEEDAQATHRCRFKSLTPWGPRTPRHSSPGPRRLPTRALKSPSRTYLSASEILRSVACSSS